MPEKIDEFLALPWQTLLTLACGYAAYYIANVGSREHHKTIDIAFSTLVFGFLATFSYQLLLRKFGDILLSSAMSFCVALLLGAGWRRWGRKWMKAVLRSSNLSHSDDLRTAWSALADAPTGVTATQLSVQLNDGTWLQCDELDRFKSAPNGPCVLGASGDVLLYVTDVHKPGADAEANIHVEDESWGQEITYIPASSIARVDLRRR